MTYYDIALLRKQQIEEVLLELMREIPYEQISVKSLTDRMEIARKTFYHYYPNKQGCLESLMDRLIMDCNMSLIDLPPEADMYDICKGRIAYWVQKRSFLEAIIQNGLSALFVERILYYISREDLPLKAQLSTEEMDCDGDVLFYYITGQVHLLLKWCAEGFPLPLDEMARKNLRLIRQPLLSSGGLYPK